MKLTQYLFCQISKKYKPNYEYKTRYDWKIRGRKMTFPRAYIPPEVQKEIQYPPEEMLTSLRYENEIKQNTIIGYEDYLNFKKPNIKELLFDENPIYRVKKPDAYIFNQYNRFEFGDIQASLLTKTKIMQSPFFNALNDNLLNDKSRQVLERFILKAYWWTTDEDKFPKRFNPRRHLYKYKAEFGISCKNSIRYLLKDLLDYSEHLTGVQQPSRLFNRDHLLETFYLWNDRRIQLMENRDFVISSEQPLAIFENQPFAWDPTEYLDVLGPVDPCIDMKITNHYPSPSSDGWKNVEVTHKYPHLITLNIDLPNIHTNFLEPEAKQITQSEKNAIGIMNCFGQCVATARRLFGDDVVDKCPDKLPHPICVHAISTDGVLFDFISYQLNTTNFADQTCSNLVWIDQRNKLFSKVNKENVMLRNTRYENLNVDVFSRFLQYFQFGIKK